MALAGAAVSDGAVGNRDELPLIAIGKKGQLQHTILTRDLLLAIGLARDEAIIRIHAARSDDELANAPSGIATSVTVLRSKPFVEVIVTVQHHVGVGFVENVEELPHPLVVAVLPRRKQRMVPVRQHAPVGVRRKFILQKDALRRIGPNAHTELVVAVQRNHPPRPQVEPVIAKPRRAGTLTEVLKISLGAGRHVFVIAWRRMQAVPEAAPSAIEAAEVLRRPIWIGIVAEREDVAANRLHQSGGGIVVPVG